MTALAETMTLVEAEGLTRLRATSDCRRIGYRLGAIASASAEQCSSGIDPYRPLDDTAAADLERIAAALDVERTDFTGVDGVEHGPNGRLAKANFRYSYFMGQEVFVYDPGYSLPNDEPGERTYEAIDPSWYLVAEHWS